MEKGANENRRRWVGRGWEKAKGNRPLASTIESAVKKCAFPVQIAGRPASAMWMCQLPLHRRN